MVRYRASRPRLGGRRPAAALTDRTSPRKPWGWGSRRCRRITDEQAVALHGGCREKGWAADRVRGVVRLGSLRRVAWPLGAVSGPGGGYPMAVELEQVVARAEQPPFRATRRSSSASEAVEAAVEFHLSEHRLNCRLAFSVERLGVVG